MKISYLIPISFDVFLATYDSGNAVF